MSHRLTRHDMVQKDQFVSSIERLAHWVENRWRQLAMAAGAIVAVAALGGLTVMWLDSRAAAADAELGKALTTLRASILPAGQLVDAGGQTGYATSVERDGAALEQLDAVIDRYPMSRAATVATYLRGAALLRLDRNDEAQEALATFTRDNPTSDLAPLARRALARAVLAGGGNDEALGILQELVDSPSRMMPVDAALLEMARAQEEAGRLTEAAETYRLLANEHPESVYSGEAAQAFARLSAAGAVPDA